MNVVSADDWRMMMLNLMQAMLGAISSNIRMVSLDHDGDCWIFSFILEKESLEDKEEIEDILCEVEALQESVIKYKVRAVVNNGEIPWPKLPERVIYRRKE